MLISELEGADVAVLGAGREGVSVARFLHRARPSKRLTFYSETAPAEEFQAVLQPLRHPVVVGPLDAAALGRHDVLVRSPGISPYRSELRTARRAGVTFTSATSLWFSAHAGARTLCVTGTKGKSTTAALAAHLLRAGGMSVQLAGNIGRPLLECADEAVDWWVIELSSYQLADLEGKPDIGVILNFSDEHLDWHGGGDQYRRDKLRLADLLAGRPLIGGYSCPRVRAALSAYDNVHWFDHPDAWHVSNGALRHGGRERSVRPGESLRGEHNLRNLAAALAAARFTGSDVVADTAAIEAALGDFAPLPHRQQRLGVRHGLEWINDSLATTPVATLAALAALAGKPITLLVGGLDRGVNWAEAIARMRELRPHAIITLPDSGPALAESMRAAGLAPPGGYHAANDLFAAVACARRVSPEGGVVLLSPGAPSFPQFRDYAERGDLFAALAGFSERTTKRGRGQG